MSLTHQTRFGAGGGLEVIPVTVEIQVETTKMVDQLKKVQILLYGTLGILRRLGLPEEVDSAIMKIQRIIAALNMLRLALYAVEMASGPMGWTVAGIGIAGTLLSTGDLMYDLGRGV